MQTSKINRLGNGVVCLLLVVCLVFSSFFNVRKAEAIAPAIPAAGAALAALAAELGISETALIAGIAVTGVAATGLVAYGNAGTDTTLPPAPGFKPWDDLTPQEKQDWVGQDGNALDYQKQTIAWWALQYGLLEQTPNGDLQPTPEPDPGNDPDGNSRWNKIRNGLIALSVAGASIPLSDFLGSVADSVSGGIHNLLFGPNELALSYAIETSVNNRLVYFQTIEPFGTGATSTNYACFIHRPATGYTSYYLVIPNSTPTVSLYFNTQSSINMWVNSTALNGRQNAYNYNTGSTSTATGKYSIQSGIGQGPTYYNLNPFYSGGYSFVDNYGNEIANYTDGRLTGDVGNVDYDYGQLSDSPQELSQGVINNNNYNNFITNYSDPGVDGYQRAITVPQGYGDSGYTPNYSDFVVVTPDDDVTPLPDDGQIEVPDPDNPSNPDTPNTEYEQDFGQRVGELLAQPFDQLFPFCLIGDLRDFLEILEDAGFGSHDQNGMRALSDEPVNGIDVLRFDLTGFNVDGAEYFEIELTPIHDFAVGFRGIATSVFIIMLLIGTFRFFINRGGE